MAGRRLLGQCLTPHHLHGFMVDGGAGTTVCQGWLERVRAEGTHRTGGSQTPLAPGGLHPGCGYQAGSWTLPHTSGIARLLAFRLIINEVTQLQQPVSIRAVPDTRVTGSPVASASPCCAGFRSQDLLEIPISAPALPVWGRRWRRGVGEGKGTGIDVCPYGPCARRVMPSRAGGRAWWALSDAAPRTTQHTKACGPMARAG